MSPLRFIDNNWNIVLSVKCYLAVNYTVHNTTLDHFFALYWKCDILYKKGQGYTNITWSHKSRIV